MPDLAVRVDDATHNRIIELEVKTGRDRVWLIRHALNALTRDMASDVEGVLMGLRDAIAGRVSPVANAPALRVTRAADMLMNGLLAVAGDGERETERARNQALLRNLNTLAGQPDDSRVGIVADTLERSWPTIGRRAVFRMDRGTMLVLSVTRA